MVLCFLSPAGFSGSPAWLQKASRWGGRASGGGGGTGRLGAAFGSDDDVISIISGWNTPEKMAQMC